ncbi:MAG TPA: hypothetical protein VHM92_11435 [Allosphingosinicella sp.]|nr:hypothetical protein [Allosphingosinicella sp.]
MGLLSYQLAYDAIEEWVLDRREDYSGRWQEIVPGEEWGYDSEAWEAAASRIVDNFNDRLPVGQEVDVPRAAKRNSRTTPLVDFQGYLAAKADAVNAAAVTRRMEG